MKRPKIIHGILVAAVLSIAVVLWSVWLWMLGFGYMAVRLAIAVISFLYILYILRQSKRENGRLALALGSVIVLAQGLISYSLVSFILLAAGVIWVVRSLLAYSSLLPALVDGFLCLLSLWAAFWAFSVTGNIVAAVWCFFLGQALFVYIPARFQGTSLKDVFSLRSGDSLGERSDSFVQAHRVAEQALRAVIEQSVA